MNRARKQIWIIFALPIVPIIASCLWFAIAVQQSDKDHALILAIKRRDTVTAIRLLNHGAGANAQDRPWKPVTFQSLIAETMARIRGAKPAKVNNTYSSAIALWFETDHYSAPNDYVIETPEKLELIQDLLAHGADANAIDSDGMSVLHYAVMADHYKTITLLLDHGARPDIPSRDVGIMPLWYANLKGTELLIAHGANVNMRSSDGETALFSTPLDEEYGVDKAKLLLANGADVNAVDETRMTPLMQVASWHNVDLMQLFYDHGAQVNARDRKGCTALIWVFYSPDTEDHTREVRWLLEHGAQVNFKDKVGKTALDYAENESRSNPTVIRLLNQAMRKERKASKSLRRPDHRSTIGQ